MGLFLLVYDIGENEKRMRFIEYIERWGLRRIQRSAFVGRLPASRIKDIAREAEKIIDLGNDVVHIIEISPAEWERAVVIGTSRWSAGLPKDSVMVK